MTDVRARKGDLCAYQTLTGGYTTADHKRVAAKPVWRIGRIDRCNREGVAQVIVDLHTNAILRKPAFSRVLIASAAFFSPPAVERLVAEYADRFTPENFASQGDFENAHAAALFVKGFAL